MLCCVMLCGVVWCGVVWCGVVLCCVVLCCVVLCCVVFVLRNDLRLRSVPLYCFKILNNTVETRTV